MATSTLDTAVPESVVLHHDHQALRELDRMIDKVRAAQTLGLDFTLSTHAGHDERNRAGRCLELTVSVSAERIHAQQFTERGLSAARLALELWLHGYRRAVARCAVRPGCVLAARPLLWHRN